VLAGLEAKLIAAALIVAALLAGWLAFQHHEKQIAVDAITADRKDAKAVADVQRAAETATQKENTYEAQRLAARAADDAALARDAGARLQQRAVAAGGRATAAAAAGSAPAAGADVVPADVFGRVVDVARQLAAVADQRGIAGDTCERDYSALTAAASGPETRASAPAVP
jgi:hypothetical protein